MAQLRCGSKKTNPNQFLNYMGSRPTLHTHNMIYSCSLHCEKANFNHRISLELRVCRSSTDYCTLCRGRTGRGRKLSIMFNNKNTQRTSCWPGFKGKANLLYKGEKWEGYIGAFRQNVQKSTESITLILVTFLLNCFPFSLIHNGTTCRMPCVFSILTYFGMNTVFKPNV